MEGKTDNELIAEFMGVKRTVSGRREISGRRYSILRYPQNLKYNSDWSWLMPVVEKIRKVLEEMHKSMPPNSANKGDMIDVDLSCGFMGVPDIEVIYKHSVEFIKWYNIQKEK